MDKELFKQLDTITEALISIDSKTKLIITKLDELIAALHEYDNDDINPDCDWEHDFDIGGSE
jgi:hypothetical protein